MKKILNFFFNVDAYIILEPDKFVTSLNLTNILKNVLFFLKKFQLKKIIKYFFFLLRFISIKIVIIFYLPLIIFFKYSKYRFLRLSSNQLGSLAHNLDAQIKLSLLEKKKPIVILPKYSPYEKNFRDILINDFIYINNSFISILLLPLIFSDSISYKPEDVETFLFKKKNIKCIKNTFYNKILSEYEKKFKNSATIFKLKREVSYNLEDKFKKLFNNINIKNTFVIHVRDSSFYKTSLLRTANLNNYIPTIKYLLSKNYQIIRLVHNNEKKIFFKKNYFEFNHEKELNKSLQTFIVKNCKGIICCHGGPSSFAAMLGTPICQTNVIPFDHVHANKEKDVYIHKKVFKNKQIINYNFIFKTEFKYLYNVAQLKDLKLIENSSLEIINAVKEFVDKLKDKSTKKKSFLQKKYYKILPKNLSIKYSNAKISEFFIKNNISLLKK